MKKFLIYAAGIVLVILIIFLFTRKKPADSSKNLIAEVKYGKFTVNVLVTGELIAEKSENIIAPSLRSPGIGWIRVKIQDIIPEGTVVKQGDYVATLDKSELANRLKDFSDEILKIESQLIRTQLDSAINLREARNNIINLNYGLEEAKIKLEQSKFEPPATIRQAEIDYDKAIRSLNQAKENYKLKVEQYKASMNEVNINLNLAKRRYGNLDTLLQQFTIRAPKAGMVIYLKEWNGQKRKVGAQIDDYDRTVATLPDLSSMLSKTYVNEIDISKIKPGQDVIVNLDAFPEKTFPGKVTEVANVGEQLPNTDSKVFEVIIKVFGTDTVMRPSMTTGNLIKTGEYDNVLYIPLEALHSNDSLTYVFLENHDKQIVVTGEANENHIIIEKGLKAGEKILLVIPENAEKQKYRGLELMEDIKKKTMEKKKQQEDKWQDSLRKNQSPTF